VECDMEFLAEWAFEGNPEIVVGVDGTITVI
jgi:hypothetical protein